MLIVLALGGATFICPHGARRINRESKFSLDWRLLIYIFHEYYCYITKKVSRAPSGYMDIYIYPRGVREIFLVSRAQTGYIDIST